MLVVTDDLGLAAVLYSTLEKGMSEFDCVPHESGALEEDFRLDGVQNDKDVLPGYFRVALGEIRN